MSHLFAHPRNTCYKWFPVICRTLFYILQYQRKQLLLGFLFEPLLFSVQLLEIVLPNIDEVSLFKNHFNSSLLIHSKTLNKKRKNLVHYFSCYIFDVVSRFFDGFPRKLVNFYNVGKLTHVSMPKRFLCLQRIARRTISERKRRPQRNSLLDKSP